MLTVLLHDIKSLEMEFLNYVALLIKKGYKINLTFDDGYRSFYTDLFPFCKDKGIGVKIFLITSRINHDNYLSSDQIREMDSSKLVDFQFHSHYHRLGFVSKRLKHIIRDDYDIKRFSHLFGSEGKIGYPVFEFRSLFAHRELFFDYSTLNYLSSIYRENRKKYLSELDRFSDKFVFEREEDFVLRIKKEIEDGIEVFKNILGRVPTEIAWPFGHSSEIVKNILKNYGINRFYTCKKGFNYNFRFEDIKRVEFRKPTESKLKFLYNVGRIKFLGKAYELLS